MFFVNKGKEFIIFSNMIGQNDFFFFSFKFFDICLSEFSLLNHFVFFFWIFWDEIFTLFLTWMHYIFLLPIFRALRPELFQKKECWRRRGIRKLASLLIYLGSDSTEHELTVIHWVTLISRSRFPLLMSTILFTFLSFFHHRMKGVIPKKSSLRMLVAVLEGF